MDRTAAVRARGVTKRYGDVLALDGVDLDLPPGDLHGLVGPNGAGKTTLLGLLLGLSAPDEGELEVLGAAVSRRRGVPDTVAGFVDAPAMYPSLTARQNLAAVRALRGGTGDVAQVLHEVGLEDVADERVGGYSLGMRQRLGLAGALLLHPRLLVLDEPANGLDPVGKRHVHDVLSRLAREGTTVVLSSHRMDDLTALCSRVTILATGRVAFTGTLDALSAVTPELDYRLVTSDPAAARQVAASYGLTLLPDPSPLGGSGAALHVHGPVEAVDGLVAALVRRQVAVRELGPVRTPLEAAYLSLTGGAPAEPLATAGAR